MHKDLYPTSHRAGKDTRRRKKPAVPSDPLSTRAKLVADIMFERAKKIVDAMAPDHPIDTEPLEPEEQWEVLFTVAQQLSPFAWEDPAAVEDFFELASKFAPHMADPGLKEHAKVLKQSKKYEYDPSITPASAEWEQMSKRLGVA